jgi:Domain of unknown function (DUF4386)
MASTPVARAPGSPRWAALGGVAYVVLFVAGAIVAFSGTPDLDAPPAEVIDYYGDSGNRDKLGIGWALIVLGIFCFLWFLSALRQFLRRIDADGLLTTLATVGGAVYAALALAAIGLETAIKTMSDDTYRDRVFPELIHAAGDAGYVMHSSGGIGVGALMIAASLATMRAGLIPRWAGSAGVGAGILALGSILFFPQILIALWVIVASVLLFRAAPPAQEAIPGAGSSTM